MQEELTKAAASVVITPFVGASQSRKGNGVCEKTTGVVQSSHYNVWPCWLKILSQSSVRLRQDSKSAPESIENLFVFLTTLCFFFLDSKTNLYYYNTRNCCETTTLGVASVGSFFLMGGGHQSQQSSRLLQTARSLSLSNMVCICFHFVANNCKIWEWPLPQAVSILVYISHSRFLLTPSSWKLFLQLGLMINLGSFQKIPVCFTGGVSPFGCADGLCARVVSPPGLFVSGFSMLTEVQWFDLSSRETWFKCPCLL